MKLFEISEKGFRIKLVKNPVSNDRVRIACAKWNEMLLDKNKKLVAISFAIFFIFNFFFVLERAKSKTLFQISSTIIESHPKNQVKSTQ